MHIGKIYDNKIVLLHVNPILTYCAIDFPPFISSDEFLLLL